MVNDTLRTRAASSSPSVVIIGAAHLDRIARADGPYRAGASNPGTLTERPGGAAFNAACALRRWNVATHLIGGRGGDAAGEAVSDALDRAGIGNGLICWLDRATPSYTALLDEAGELVGGVAAMDLYDLLRPRVLSRAHVRTALSGCDAIMVDANLPDDTLRLITARREAPVAAIAVSPAKIGRLRGVLPMLSMLFASRREATALLEVDEASGLQTLAAPLKTAGVSRAVVTDGSREALVIEGQDAWLQMPPHIDAVRDVTGAGDTLAAVTFAEWIRGRPLEFSVRIGMAAAGLHISAGLGQDAPALSRLVAESLPAAQTIPV